MVKFNAITPEPQMIKIIMTPNPCHININHCVRINEIVAYQLCVRTEIWVKMSKRSSLRMCPKRLHTCMFSSYSHLISFHIYALWMRLALLPMCPWSIKWNESSVYAWEPIKWNAFILVTKSIHQWLLLQCAYIIPIKLALMKLRSIPFRSVHNCLVFNSVWLVSCFIPKNIYAISLSSRVRLFI